MTLPIGDSNPIYEDHLIFLKLFSECCAVVYLIVEHLPIECLSAGFVVTSIACLIVKYSNIDWRTIKCLIISDLPIEYSTIKCLYFADLILHFFADEYLIIVDHLLINFIIESVYMIISCR